MTTKFRVETVMTTSIHLRMRSAEDQGILKRMILYHKPWKKAIPFSKKVSRKNGSVKCPKLLDEFFVFMYNEEKSKGETPCLPC